MMRLQTRIARLFLLACLTVIALISLIHPIQASSGADWPMWGHDLSNTRYNPDESTITPANVGSLELKWAFAFPNTGIASSQPTVIGDTVYIGSWNGNLYALDAATGQQRWAFFTGITGKTGAIRVGPAVSHGLVMFGDQLGRFFAVNESNGTLAWIQQDFEKHPLAQITGSPVVYGDHIYVPMSSREENASSDPTYQCCTFRGSLTALNIQDGSIEWRFYTVGEPKPLSTQGPFTGPSGVSIWSTPAIDPDAGLIYLATDNNYAPPVSPYSDSLMALNLNDGTVKWSTQLTAGDWNNKGCNQTPKVNCDGTPGDDIGFGAAPLLFSVGSRKFVAAEQKTGVLHILDALTGKIVWEKTIGATTTYVWGMTFDGKNLYISDNTFEKNGAVYALDPLTGDVKWQTVAMPCTAGPDQAPADCWSGFMAAAISTPGLVWLGAMDGQFRALDSSSGKVLWTYDTAQRGIATVNGVAGNGGSIGPANATVANGQVYVASGYAAWDKRMLEGNILFVFGLPRAF